MEVEFFDDGRRKIEELDGAVGFLESFFDEILVAGVLLGLVCLAEVEEALFELSADDEILTHGAAAVDVLQEPLVD